MKFYKLGVPFWVKTLAMGKFIYEAWEDQFSPTSGFQLNPSRVVGFGPILLEKS
jgi:hypothetical protein